MRHFNYYNWYVHDALGKYPLFVRVSNLNSFKKFPSLKQGNRHTRLYLKRTNNLKRFVYGNVRTRRRR